MCLKIYFWDVTTSWYSILDARQGSEYASGLLKFISLWYHGGYTETMIYAKLIIIFSPN